MPTQLRSRRWSRGTPKQLRCSRQLQPGWPASPAYCHPPSTHAMITSLSCMCRCMGPISVKLTGDLFASVCQDEPMLRAHVATIRLADVGECCSAPQADGRQIQHLTPWAGVVDLQGHHSSSWQHSAICTCVWYQRAAQQHSSPVQNSPPVWVVVL